MIRKNLLFRCSIRFFNPFQYHPFKGWHFDECQIDWRYASLFKQIVWFLKIWNSKFTGTVERSFRKENFSHKSKLDLATWKMWPRVWWIKGTKMESENQSDWDTDKIVVSQLADVWADKSKIRKIAKGCIHIFLAPVFWVNKSKMRKIAEQMHPYLLGFCFFISFFLLLLKDSMRTVTTRVHLPIFMILIDILMLLEKMKYFFNAISLWGRAVAYDGAVLCVRKRQVVWWFVRWDVCGVCWHICSLADEWFLWSELGWGLL